MRFLTLLLTLLLVFSLVACGGADSEGSTGSNVSTSKTPEKEPEPSVSSEPSSEAPSSEDPSSEAPSASEDSSVEEPSTSDTSDESSEDVEPFEPIEYEDAEIKKATGTVEIDGRIGEGEYITVFEYDADSTFWNVASDEGAANYAPKLYITWDEDFLYTAVALVPGRERTYDNTDFAANRPYIFDRRHLMSAIILGDPTDSKYIPPVGNAWEWADAYSAGYASEWTVSAQPDGTKIQADHFGELTQSPAWKYELRPSSTVEVYEQAIPWSALAGGTGFEAKAGAVIGYAFSAACEEVDITVEDGEDENSIYAGFGTGILNGKNFAHYVGLTLAE